MRYFFLKLCLFFSMAITSYSSLTAGPVYAAKWKLGEQVVCVYGDSHYTHKLFAQQEEKMPEQFLNALNKSEENVLLLLEDPYGLQYKNTFKKINSNDNDDAFLWQLIKHTLRDNEVDNFPRIDAESVDLRAEVVLFERMLGTHQDLQKALKNDPSSYAPSLEKIRQKIGTKKWIDIIFNPILYLENMIKKTNNNRKVVDVLSHIQELLVKRFTTYSMVFKKIGIKDYETLTVAELCDKTTLETELKNPEESFLYWRLLNAFDLCNRYCGNIVEAGALFRIAFASDTHKKVVVVLGDHHIAQLEKFLQEVGYECVAQEGVNNRNVLQKADSGLDDLLEKAVENDTTFIGDSADPFCTDLHYSSATCNKRPEEVKKYIQQRIENSEKEVESLVSCETFDWINE